jgi:hypothetical protein
MLYSSRFRIRYQVWGLRIGNGGLGFRVLGSGCRVHRFKVKSQVLALLAYGLGLKVLNLGFRI